MESDFLDLIAFVLKVPGLQFSVGGVLGFLLSRYTRTKGEKDVYDQRLFDNSDRLKRSKDEKYRTFVVALQATIQAKENASVTLNDFHRLATSGDLYFSELRNIADACLTGQVNKVSRDNTFVPALVEAVEKSLPAFYRTLGKISADLGGRYDAELRVDNYLSIYRAVEKFRA